MPSPRPHPDGPALPRVLADFRLVPQAASSRVAAALTDPSTDVTLSPDDAIRVFHLMCLTQTLEERLVTLYRQGRFPGGCYSGTGAEAIGVVSGYLLRHEDIICPMIRDMGARLAKGSPIETILRGYLGLSTGPMRGRDGNIHQADPENNILGMISHLGAMIAVTAGAASAERYRGGDAIGLTFIGDGGSSTGDFHEALNLAAVWKIPLVLVIEDNQYAYSTPVEQQYACARLADRAKGYGIPGATVDGTDAVAVHGALHEAVAHARRGDGPALVECKTLRFRGHGEHDDNRYMPAELLAEWQKKEPVQRFQSLLLGCGLLTNTDADAIRDDAEEQVQAALSRLAREPKPRPEDVDAGGGAFCRGADN